jgi:hypothetical protein
VCAAAAGTIDRYLVAAGDQVAAGAALVVVAPAIPSPAAELLPP